jgi:hypothetical protein
MQYKHWWAGHPSESAYTHAWPQILHDSVRIITHAAAVGITICGPDGYGWPVIDPFDGVRIGGDAALGSARITAPSPCSWNSPSPAFTGSAFKITASNKNWKPPAASRGWPIDVHHLCRQIRRAR